MAMSLCDYIMLINVGGSLTVVGNIPKVRILNSVRVQSSSDSKRNASIHS